MYSTLKIKYYLIKVIIVIFEELKKINKKKIMFIVQK